MESETDDIWNILLITDNELDMRRIRALLDEAKPLLYQLKWLRVAVEMAPYACDPHLNAVIVEYRFDSLRSGELLDAIERECPQAPILLMVNGVSDEIQAVAREQGSYRFIDINDLTPAALAEAIDGGIQSKREG